VEHERDETGEFWGGKSCRESFSMAPVQSKRGDTKKPSQEQENIPRKPCQQYIPASKFGDKGVGTIARDI